jgi:hypothetical protein
MANGATDAPLESKTNASASISERPRRRGGALVAGVLGLAIGASVIAVRTGALNRLAGVVQGVPDVALASETGRAALGAARDALPAKAELAPVSEEPPQTPGVIVTPGDAPPGPAAPPRGCSPRDPGCPKANVRYKSRAKTSLGPAMDERSPGEVLDQAGAPEQVPLEPPASPEVISPEQPSPSKPEERKPVSSEPTLTERYGI